MGEKALNLKQGSEVIVEPKDILNLDSDTGLGVYLFLDVRCVIKEKKDGKFRLEVLDVARVP